MMGYFSDASLDYTSTDAELDRRDGLTPSAPSCYICGELPSGVTLRTGGESFRICRPCYDAGYQDNERNQTAWEADIDEAALTPAELYRAERDRQRAGLTPPAAPAPVRTADRWHTARQIVISWYDDGELTGRTFYQRTAAGAGSASRKLARLATQGYVFTDPLAAEEVQPF